MDGWWLLVEFSRELDDAEAPVDCPKPWDLGVESVESARTFSKLNVGCQHHTKRMERPKGLGERLCGKRK